MEKRILSACQIADYERCLCAEERATATVKKYLRDIHVFAVWQNGHPVTRESVAEWKERLLEAGRAPSTVNGSLAALNGLFHFLEWDECRSRFLKVQRRLFREPGRDLTREDYKQLIATAQEMGKSRLSLLMETICATCSP